MAKGKGKKTNAEEQAKNRPDANKKSITMKQKKKKSVKVKAQDAEPVPSLALAPAPAPAPEALSGPSQVVASTPVTNGGNDNATKGKEKAMNNTGRHSGFIFMCNQKTKQDCFRYRVFGLPAGKKEVIERIKEPTKLFLFDTDVKLLYGVYRASGQGQMNLEPSAFGGRFPAQVKFSISRDCTPLPESVFKNAIKDNYHGSKFEPALNAKQVRSLQMLFRSCDTLTAPPDAPHLVREPPRQEVHHPHLPRLPPPVDSYLSQQQYSHPVDVLPRVEPPLPVLRHEFYRSAGSMGIGPPTTEHQRLPAHPSDRYYGMEERLPFLPENSTQFMHDRYSRYMGMQEMVPRGVTTIMPHRSPLQGERGSDQLQATIARYYNSSQTSTAPSNAYPPTATSHRAYPSAVSPHAQALMYPPRNVGSGRDESPKRSVPVSSYYTFSGPNQMYR